MVYFTGDTHGIMGKILDFATQNELTEDDTIVILGDVGTNYFLDWRDNVAKFMLQKSQANILCIHGNHEVRPSNIESYHLTEWNGGMVWVEDKFPNVKFAKDGEIYDIEGTKYFVIGGAYSVDKQYRTPNVDWWEDEQPSDEIKQYVEQQIEERDFDVVLSHTCPQKYTPTEMFLPGLEQSIIDKSTEEWLDKIEEKIDYKTWLCGHWHTDKIVDKMFFLFNSWKNSEEILRGNCE